MNRLAAPTFAALVVATIAAFFITQAVKVTTPLLDGFPAPYPAAINPVDGVTCNGVNHRVMSVSFYLLQRSDDVDVYITDQGGTIVATLASGRHMRRGVRKPDGVFVWNGREDDGRTAPDGTYYIRVDLVHQGRTVVISDSAGPEPITVITAGPHPVVTGVSPQPSVKGASPVRISYTGTGKLGVTVHIYRTDLGGAPHLAKSFFSPQNGSGTALWDGRIGGRPAPAGTYLVGLSATDAACNSGSFPATIPPAPGTTRGAGISVRYAAAEPPLDPVPAGSRALIRFAAQGPFRWALREAGGKTVASGGGTAPRASAAATTGLELGGSLRLRLPPRRARLYTLALSAGSHTTSVPVVASAPSPPTANALVVLPALTWQGLNPVDDTGDGLPQTLAAGDAIELARPLAQGLPAGFADEAALLAFLDRSGVRYDLTTDIALIDGTAPNPSSYNAVVLAGSERWLPSSVTAGLRAYVRAGGHLLSLGIDSLRRSVTVQGGRALDPSPPAPADALGATLGPLSAQSPLLSLKVLRDQLRIFKGAAARLRGFASAQAIRPSAPVLSAAGATGGAPSIVAYRLGKGIVLDVGLPGFGSALASDAGAQALLRRIWTTLTG